MRLKELEIQGFKSFPDKTKIEIGEGITGVVGPNGSGKSNISDSIRWVLGETSSKQLRGSGKMEDVIFGGTQSRGAMGYASVALTIDNSDHGLDMDADQVTIGRRYYRSGESEYSINGQNVRLKDVYELLLDTGIGRDGYSVIGQGRIAEIVAAKSSERREIFEEACGIAKYRYRKNEAERRLAAAAENLERLRDILGELEARVGPLEKESEKARKFLELSARRKTLEALNAAYCKEHRRRPHFTKITMQDKLVLTLLYRREYRSMENIAAEYGVSRDTIADNIHWVERALLNANLLQNSVTCVYQNQLKQALIQDSEDFVSELFCFAPCIDGRFWRRHATVHLEFWAEE